MTKYTDNQAAAVALLRKKRGRDVSVEELANAIYGEPIARPSNWRQLTNMMMRTLRAKAQDVSGYSIKRTTDLGRGNTAMYRME